MFLQMEDINKTYQSGDTTFQALKNVGFALEQGQICVILGPSGSGKSTLLNIIGGIDNADSGTIHVADWELNNLKEKQLTQYRREAVGFIFQFYNLVPNLTARENIELTTNISKDPLDIDEILEAVGMKEFQHHFPKELSGGQQQRISIARALVKKPKLLLCDEPTGALDYATSKEILKLLANVNKKFNTTILIITHNNAIAEMAHRVLKMRSGKIIEDMVNETLIPPERIEW
ncbi:ABC transporter ATP-binding protein [Bacillus atrophaeus]|uniref:ABC transporter ATP-binding protein n=1 Tax=Bacillus atrophaeus TaxID=1452 RepID=UPI001C0F7650|nr:ABC transporter ATP-binding protein [Bacillus atrophaeus]MBU5262770.1 ABC transporter ATP-binding protein [Bacillus atrophaeus]